MSTKLKPLDPNRSPSKELPLCESGSTYLDFHDGPSAQLSARIGVVHKCPELDL
jgi:hypothetical protein